jgi:hypothetical protein
LADLVVSSGIHKEHDQKHEVAGDTTRLRVVNLQSRLFANLCMGVNRVYGINEGWHSRLRSTLMKFT